MHVPPFKQGFGWHGLATNWKIWFRFFEKVKFCFLPGASQRLPVKVSGQLQLNPVPKGTHWPPLRPKYD